MADSQNENQMLLHLNKMSCLWNYSQKKNPRATILCLEHKMIWALSRCMTADGRVHALHQSRIELSLLCDPDWSVQKQQSFCRSICCRGCLTPGRFVKTVPLQSSEFTCVKHIWNEWETGTELMVPNIKYKPFLGWPSALLQRIPLSSELWFATNSKQNVLHIVYRTEQESPV